jgi:lactate permease
VPFWLIWAYAGFAAMIEIWPAILAAGTTFAVTQYLMAAYSGPSLIAVVAAAATILALVVLLRFWQPRRTLNVDLEDITGQALRHHGHSAAAIFKAWLPWLILSAVVFIWGLPRLSAWMDARSTVKIAVSGLHNVVQRVPPVVPAPASEAAIFNLNWLTATGTGILLAAFIAGLLMGLGPKPLFAAFAQTVFRIRYTFVTIAAMMAIGYVTRYCGLDATLGLAFARTGAFYPFFGTLIGWLGTASTGSDTSSNVLFGSLQRMTARQIGVAPVLMSSANAAGGVMGKMIAAPSVVVASTATQIYGQEGSILRFVFLHSLALACLAGICVSLLAYVPLLARLVAQ